jgi:site-specific DNA-cytosine methylase
LLCCASLRHVDQDAEGPLSEENYAVNRSDLPSYHGRIRRFHPDELLAISGFPKAFSWPSGELLSLEKCSGVVGNSVNVAVVKCIMQALFGVTEVHQNDEEED